MDNIQQFLDTFLIPPKGKSPQEIRDRFKHWAEVYAHPEQFTKDHNPHALAAKRKSARQCLRRLTERHPDIAKVLLEERQAHAPEVTK